MGAYGVASDHNDSTMDWIGTECFWKGEELILNQSGANRALKKSFDEIKKNDKSSEKYELDTYWAVGVSVNVLNRGLKVSKKYLLKSIKLNEYYLKNFYKGLEFSSLWKSRIKRHQELINEIKMFKKALKNNGILRKKSK
jgi:hypothetical protein